MPVVLLPMAELQARSALHACLLFVHSASSLCTCNGINLPVQSLMQLSKKHFEVHRTAPQHPDTRLRVYRALCSDSVLTECSSIDRKETAPLRESPFHLRYILNPDRALDGQPFSL